MSAFRHSIITRGIGRSHDDHNSILFEKNFSSTLKFRPTVNEEARNTAKTTDDLFINELCPTLGIVTAGCASLGPSDRRFCCL
jgi:hypothetical protein